MFSCLIEDFSWPTGQVYLLPGDPVTLRPDVFEITVILGVKLLGTRMAWWFGPARPSGGGVLQVVFW